MSISAMLAWLSGSVGSAVVEKIVDRALAALARRRGTIECVAVATDSYALGVVEGAMLEEKPTLPISSSIFTDAVMQIVYRIQVKLHNGTLEPSSLRNMGVILVDRDGVELSLDLFEGDRKDAEERKVDSVRLEPRDPITLSLEVHLGPDLLVKKGYRIGRYVRAELVGRLPNGRSRRWPIRFPHVFKRDPARTSY